MVTTPQAPIGETQSQNLIHTMSTNETPSLASVIASLSSAKALRDAEVKAAKEKAAKGEKLIAGQDAAQRIGLTVAAAGINDIVALGFEPTSLRATTNKAGEVTGFTATFKQPVTLEQRRTAMLAGKAKRKVTRFRAKNADLCKGLDDAAVLELATASAAEVEAKKKAAEAAKAPAPKFQLRMPASLAA